MSTRFVGSDHWCVCGRAHASFCLEEPCYFGATWPHPYEPLQTMEDMPWMSVEQARRHAVFAAQRAQATTVGGRRGG